METFSEDGLFRFETWVEDGFLMVKMSTTPEYEHLIEQRLNELWAMIDSGLYPEWLEGAIKGFIGERA